MKTLLLVCSLFLALAVKSQTTPADKPRMTKEERQAHYEKIKAMETAFITRELALTIDESQKFWPVFNQYRQEGRAIWKDRSITDPLEKQQKMLDLRKKYRTDFVRMLGEERGNRVFLLEERFRSLIRREWQERKGAKPGIPEKAGQ